MDDTEDSELPELGQRRSELVQYRLWYEIQRDFAMALGNVLYIPQKKPFLVPLKSSLEARDAARVPLDRRFELLGFLDSDSGPPERASIQKLHHLITADPELSECLIGDIGETQ